MFYLVQFLSYGLPIAAVIFFVVSLVRYLHARSVNRHAPETYDKRQMTARLVCLIVSASIAGTMLLTIFAVIGLLFTVVAFM